MMCIQKDSVSPVWKRGPPKHDPKSCGGFRILSCVAVGVKRTMDSRRRRIWQAAAKWFSFDEALVVLKQALRDRSGFDILQHLKQTALLIIMALIGTTASDWGGEIRFYSRGPNTPIVFQHMCAGEVNNTEQTNL